MARPTDEDVELSVAAMLRWGVTSAAVVLFIGGMMVLRHPEAAIPDFSHFHAVDVSLRTLSGIVIGALHLEPRHLIQLGLLVLIATPIARVVFCVVGFARQRDTLYVLVSVIVLAILLYSVSSGAR